MPALHHQTGQPDLKIGHYTGSQWRRKADTAVR